MGFQWILVVSYIVAFATAVGIGANDASNSFGTCYGAGTLEMKHIVLLGGICEFVGAVLLGAEVSKTIGSSVVDVSAFQKAPYVYAHAMMCVLVSTAMWLAVATWTKLPVSTSHSVIGAVIGVAIVWGAEVGAGGGIRWVESKEAFPFVDGLVPLIVGWVVAPVLSGLCAALTYWLLCVGILREDLTDEVLRAFEEADAAAEIVTAPGGIAAAVAAAPGSQPHEPDNNGTAGQVPNGVEAAITTAGSSTIKTNNGVEQEQARGAVVVFVNRHRVRVVFSFIVFVAFFVDPPSSSSTRECRTSWVGRPARARGSRSSSASALRFSARWRRRGCCASRSSALRSRSWTGRRSAR